MLVCYNSQYSVVDVAITLQAGRPKIVVWFPTREKMFVSHKTFRPEKDACKATIQLVSRHFSLVVTRPTHEPIPSFAFIACRIDKYTLMVIRVSYVLFCSHNATVLGSQSSWDFKRAIL